MGRGKTKIAGGTSGGNQGGGRRGGGKSAAARVMGGTSVTLWRLNAE